MRLGTSDRVRVGPKHLGQVVIVLHVGVRRTHVAQGEGRARCERPGLEAVLHPRAQLFELADAARPRHPRSFGVRGNDVRRVAAVRDDAVNLVERAQMLAQQTDRDLGDRERVGRVHAQLRSDRRVRLPARVLHADVRDRADARVEVFHRRRMHHQRRVHSVEGAAVEHQDLAAATFLGRRADHRQRDAELVGERREREPGSYRGGGDDVVSARVTDHRKRVVLGADRDVQRPVAHLAAERGR